MTGERFSDYIDHMIEAVGNVLSYVDGIGKDAFLDDRRTQQAVILNFIVLGEVATKLLRDHGETLEGYPAISWRNMKGMRNRMAHGYFDIDLDVVWETVASSLPPLLAQLQDLRKTL